MLLDHLEGVLPETEEDRFARHLAECPRCSGELAEYAGILALARSEPAPKPAPGTGDRLRAALRRELAAAGAAGSAPPRARPASRLASRFWSPSSWRRLAIAVPALAAVVVVVLRLTGPTAHAPVPSSTARTPVVATAPESTAAPEITATEIASNPALQGEISSYETDRMLELGTDSAAESMDKTEQQAFTRLLDQELEALMRKHAASGERSSLTTSLEEVS